MTYTGFLNRFKVSGVFKVMRADDERDVEGMKDSEHESLADQTLVAIIRSQELRARSRGLRKKKDDADKTTTGGED